MNASTNNTPGRKTLARWAAYMALLNTPVVAFMLYRYVKAMPGVEGAAAGAFLTLSVVGHAFAIAAVTAAVLLVLALLMPYRRVLVPAGVALFTVVGLVLAVDSSLYRLYRFHLNGMVWELLTGGAATELLPIAASAYVVAALLLVLYVLLMVVAARLALGLASRGRTPVALLAAAAAVLVAANVMHAWADAVEYTPIVRLVRHLPLYKPLTAKRALRKLGWQSSAHAAVPTEAGKGSFAYPLERIEPVTAEKPLNVLYILVDGWRQDDMNARVTPNISRFAEANFTFTDHYSSGNATRFGVFGFFYSIYGTYWYDALAEQRPPVVVEAARKAGYEFGVFASAPLTSPEFDRTVFVSVRDRIQLETEGANAVERDRKITDQFVNFLDDNAKSGKPFFGFLFYDSPHSYAWPEDYEPAFTPYVETLNHLTFDENTETLPVHNRLRNSYHFVDSLVGRVLDELSARGLAENTFIVISSDHGEEVNDSGTNYWGHNSAFTTWQVRVPMVVGWPGRGGEGKGEVYGHTTVHADLAPTVMHEVFGVDADPANYSNGKMLTDATGRDYVLAAGWNTFGILTKDRIDVSTQSKTWETYHPDYTLWPDAPPNTAVMLKALDEMGRFYSTE